MVEPEPYFVKYLQVLLFVIWASGSRGINHLTFNILNFIWACASAGINHLSFNIFHLIWAISFIRH